MTHPPLVMDVDGIRAYLRDVWPPFADEIADAIEVLEPGAARLRTVTGPEDLRPGGTVSGPVLMTLLDQAAYALVLGHLGPAGLAVTSHMSVEFLRRPEPGILLTAVELLKLGRTQITMAARITAADPASPPLVASTIVYSRALLGEGTAR